MKITCYSIFRGGLLLAALMMLAGGSLYAQYCTPSFATGCGTGHSIYSVSTTGGMVNFTNNNTACANNSTSYSDYTLTNMQVKQEAFKTVDVKVQYGQSSSNPSGASSITKIYVDWGRDGTFDPGDIVLPSAPGPPGWVHSNGGTTITAKVTVPGTAKEGITRMRVITGSQGPIYASNLGPCGGANYGEAEDYNFEVVNPCLPPNVISVANLDFTSADISWTSKLNAEFYEFIITPVDTIPNDTVFGFNYTTNNHIDIDTFECNKKYYVLVRVICDTLGKATKNWSRSDWTIDSFITEPCCYMPEVVVKDVTSTTAKASWDPVPTAYGYEFAVSTTPDPPQQGTYTVNTTLLLQGLESKKTHFVHVRSRCNPTPLSGWTKASFKTLKGLAVDELGNAVFGVDAYPNPVQDKLTIQVNGERDNNARISIVDLTGKVVYTSAVDADKMVITIDHLVPGIYVVKYADDTHNDIMKITKQ